MKEAIVHAGPKVEIIDSPMPKPGPDEVLIRVVVSGSNPKDWKRPEWNNDAVNQGDDIAGTVHAVGAHVTEFHRGDRVAAFHDMSKPHGSYAEFAVAPSHTTFHVPFATPFEAAATIPLAAMTAAVGLYARLGLPEPWRAPKQPLPLVVYGAASAVGAYTIKLARRSGIHPLIGVAGRGIPFAESLIDKSAGDTIVDYRRGDEAVVSGIREALGGQKLMYAFDAVSEKGSFVNICKVLEPQGGRITLVLPTPKDAKSGFPEGVERSQTMVGSVFSKDKDFALAWYRLMGSGLKDGWFQTHPYEVVPGGLNGVEAALTNLKDGKASAVKYVFKIAETRGAEKL